MLGKGRNKAVVRPGAVGQERLAEGGDGYPHLDLTLSLSCEGTSQNLRNVNPQVVPSVEVPCPDTLGGTQDRIMGTSARGAFLMGRARARIDHWRRAAIFVERATGLPTAYLPTWTATTTTIAVNTVVLHGRVLGHAGIVTGPTGARNNSCQPPFLIGGSINLPLVQPQSGVNNHPAPYVLPPIRSNLVPMFTTSAATARLLVVTTTGNGPNGRQIYGVVVGQSATSWEMHIMCSCHGMVLSPAAFVDHAGGTNSSQRPMDRIIACLTPVPF